MQATKELPANYEVLYSLNLTKNKFVAIGLNLVALLIFLVLGAGFARLSLRLRPEFWASGHDFEIFEIVSLAIALVLMVVLHEGVHGLFFWVITRQRPVFGVKLMYAYAAAPDWYIRRNPFIVVGLAPLVLLSLLGVALMPVVPLAWMPALLFFLTFNGAGSVGDLYTVVLLLFRPNDVLVQDMGDSFTIFGETPPG